MAKFKRWDAEPGTRLRRGKQAGLSLTGSIKKEAQLSGLGLWGSLPCPLLFTGPHKPPRSGLAKQGGGG